MSIHPRRLASGRVAYDVKIRSQSGVQFSKTFRTRREAESFQARERTAMNSGSWIDPRSGTISVNDYASSWLTMRSHLRPRTIEQYESLLSLHVLPHLGQKQIKSLTVAEIRTWYSDIRTKGLCHNTAAKAYRLFRTILGTAVEDDLIAKNPGLIKGAGIERHAERPVISINVVNELVAAIDPRYRAMVQLATWAGLRYGEATGLHRSDLDLDNGVVIVRRQLTELKNGQLIEGPPKTDAGHRRIALPPHVIADLEAHLRQYVGNGNDDYVFTTAERTPLRRSNFNRRVWQPACRSIGLNDFRFHDLRHTGNTLAASTGASTKELMSRMGHSSARAALIYQHATFDRDRSIAAALSELAINSNKDKSLNK